MFEDLEYYFVRGNKIMASWEVEDGSREEAVVCEYASEKEAKAKLSKYRQFRIDMDSEHEYEVHQSTRDSWLY